MLCNGHHRRYEQALRPVSPVSIAGAVLIANGTRGVQIADSSSLPAHERPSHNIRLELELAGGFLAMGMTSLVADTRCSMPSPGASGALRR